MGWGQSVVTWPKQMTLDDLRSLYLSPVYCDKTHVEYTFPKTPDLHGPRHLPKIANRRHFTELSPAHPTSWLNEPEINEDWLNLVNREKTNTCSSLREQWTLSWRKSLGTRDLSAAGTELWRLGFQCIQHSRSPWYLAKSKNIFEEMKELGNCWKCYLRYKAMSYEFISAKEPSTVPWPTMGNQWLFDSTNNQNRIFKCFHIRS